MRRTSNSATGSDSSRGFKVIVALVGSREIGKYAEVASGRAQDVSRLMSRSTLNLW